MNVLVMLCVYKVNARGSKIPGFPTTPRTKIVTWKENYDNAIAGGIAPNSRAGQALEVREKGYRLQKADTAQRLIT